MTDPYTPDTIDVKVAYCSAFDPGFAHKVMSHRAAEMTTGHAADFDRWLREVKAEVWAEGYHARAYAPLGPGGIPTGEPVNPYRLTEEPTT